MKNKKLSKRLFPRSKFADTMTPYMQATHVLSEVKELAEEIANDNWQAAVLEAYDVIHSVETLLFILAEQKEIDVSKSRHAVWLKNYARGYYDKND